MQIYCPRCKTGYEIEAAVVPEKGRKLRCAVCQKVFMCMPADLIDGSKLRQAEFTEEEKQHLDEHGHLREEEIAEVHDTEVVEEASQNAELDSLPETEESEVGEPEENKNQSLDDLASDNQYVKDIFKRLSVETENLFQADKEAPKAQKYIFAARKMLGLANLKNLKYYIWGFLFMLVLVLYYWRYEVVRQFPLLGQVYAICGIEAVVPGEGLEFQNVVRREFEDDYVPKLEVKGFIANQTAESKKVPLIKVELLDENGKMIQVETFSSVIPVITEKAKIPFSHVISRPSPLSKYIYLTFIADPDKE